MRKPSRSAIRWGAPVALAAAAIAALLVVPVFGGTLTTTKLRNKVNATELRVIGTKKLKPLGDPHPVIATLRPKPGDYVVTSTFTAHSERPSSESVGCALLVGQERDDGQNFGVRPGPDSEPPGTQFSQNSTLSVTAHVGANGKAQLICTSSRPNKRGFLTNIEITALKVPKITLKTQGP